MERCPCYEQQVIHMRFGDFLINEKLVTQEQLNRALDYQRDYNRPMGIFAQKLGFISRKDNVRILLEHIKTGKRYGDIAVEKGFMTQEQIRKVLEAQSRDSVMLGKILVQNGALTKSQLLQALKIYFPSMSEME
jgi:aspartate ammonia-lyase